MRPLAACLALFLATAAALPAAALPRGPAAAERGVVTVENRFLPRIFGGGDDKRRAESDMALRIDQLENQVRTLTGQVEELTYTVRQLQAAIAAGPGAATAATPPMQRSDARPGPGEPPRTLGTLSGNTAVAGSNPSGPIDLSAINGRVADPALGNRATTSGGGGGAGDPLATAREYQQSGRYARAADEARAVLASNPRGPVASEARYLLGEALLAQGDYREAANLFLENYTTDPNGKRAPESLLKLGTALNGLGEREAACSSLDELFGAYPNIDPAVRAAAERERRTANCV